MRKADRYRCRYAVYYALTCVQSLLGAHIPSPILKRLRPAIPVRLLMPVTQLLLRDRPVPQRLERYVKFLLIDDQEGRWRAAQSWRWSSKPWLINRNRASRRSTTIDITAPGA